LFSSTLFNVGLTTLDLELELNPITNSSGNRMLQSLPEEHEETEVPWQTYASDRDFSPYSA